MVGNVLIDNIRYNKTRLVRPAVLDTLGVKDGGYIVFTLNRKALMAARENLKEMLAAMTEKAAGTPIIAPLRGETAVTVRALLAEGCDVVAAWFHFVEPLGYLEFGYLTAHAKGIITDSGNVAEEATFYGVPCITLNSYTEHIETVKQGTNVLVGEDASLLGTAVADMVTGCWKTASIPERWDGRSAERIVQILLEQ